MKALVAMLCSLALPGQTAPSAPQALRIDHFVQRGAGDAAALHGRVSNVLCLCGGGIAEAFGGQVPPQEVLLQWLQSTDVIAAAARDLPFWAAATTDGVRLVATNLRDRDGQAFGRPFHVVQAGPIRLAVLAVVLGAVPAGFTTTDALTAVRAALPAAQKDSDAALLVVDGDLAAARALLAACPEIAVALVTGDRRCSPRLLREGAGCLVQSPQAGTALGELSLQWDGTALQAIAHRFVPTFLDEWGLQQSARLQAATAPVVAAEDDAGVVTQGLGGFGIEPAAIEAAIRRGATFLQQELQRDAGERTPLGHANDHVLMALALVHAGVHRRDPEFDRAVRSMLRQRDVVSLGVYSAGLFCMLVEAYGEPEFYGRLRAAARYLVEGQSASGSWTYAPQVDPALCSDPDRRVLQVTGGTPPPGDAGPAVAWERTMPWNAHDSGDNSLTQFALLGLRAAQRCSVPVPAATWRRAGIWLRRGQRQGGAFGYGPVGLDGYGSMTLAGICGLAIVEHELGNVEFARDLGIRRGLAWLRSHFAVDQNPESGSHLYYYLYSLERTGRIFGRDVLCGAEWYPLGARQLLRTQLADGSWPQPFGGETTRLTTSFALLFLTRSTQQLHVERQHGGNGTLQTFAQMAPGARIYVILDASGSMLETAGGGTRFDLARQAVEAVLSALPPGPQVALRVYGHRKRAVDAGADEDTELLVPLGPFDRAAFFARLHTLRARGKTPLARSLSAAAADLAGGAGGATTVVLLTDGGEDSMPRQDPTVAAAALGKLAGLRLHVVGFDIQRDDWQAQLRAMANAGHGDYLPAGSADLAAELRAAVLQAPAGFVVRSPDGTELRRGRFGEALALPEGRYRLAATFRGQEFATDLWIDTAATTAVVFDGSQALAVEQGQPGVRICPGCRHPVAAAAKFCPECGARLPVPH